MALTLESFASKLFICCLCFGGWAVWRLIKYRKTAVARLRGPKSSSWLLGNLVEFANSHGDQSASLDWYKTYGPVCRFKGYLGRDHLHVVDPKAIAFMLSQGLLFEKDFADKPRIAAIFGQGLHSSIGEQHRRLRRIMVPAFAWQQITPLATIFQKSAVEVKDRWVEQIKAAQGSAQINMGYDFSLGFLNALGEGAFGYDFNAFDHGSMTPLFKAMMYIDSVSSQRTYKQILLESTVDQLPVSFLNVIFALPIAAGKPLKNQIDVMRRAAKELFSLGVQDAQSDAVSSRNDLLSVLIKANLTAQSRYQLSAEEVQAQLMTFVTAGLSTVLSTHTQLMRHVILNPEVQSKLRAEMLALGDHPTVDQLDVAPYLELVVREALRMTDFVPLERIAQRDTLLPLSQPVTLEDGTVLDAIPIKKGQSIHIPITAVSRNKDRFGEDADAFRPDRWAGEKGEALRNYHGLGPGSWNGMISFGGGERSCIGAKFGLLEIKIFAHLLLTTFKFDKGETEWTPVVSLLEK